MLKSGDTFGDYRVVSLLGQGGMGSVYLLENASGARVAAKILDPVMAGDHEARKRFVREAELALGVKHPNLVETYDVGEDPDTGLCYILMEFVPGGSLADRLEAGPLPIDEAIRIISEISSVLELAREKGIVHRDIKPANIMFGADGAAKLADLGIARGTSSGAETMTVTQTGVMMGTPAYMAPEQMFDAHRVDGRADIYSLGIVFYEMLTGVRPNKDDTVVELMAKAVKGERLPDVRKMRPEVSASVAKLISLMCEVKADRRVQTAAEVTAAIMQIMRGEKLTLKRRPSGVAAILLRKTLGVACAALALVGVASALCLKPRQETKAPVDAQSSVLVTPSALAAPTRVPAVVGCDVSSHGLSNVYCDWVSGRGKPFGKDARFIPLQFKLTGDVLDKVNLLVLTATPEFNHYDFDDLERKAIREFAERGGVVLALVRATALVGATGADNRRGESHGTLQRLLKSYGATQFNAIGKARVKAVLVKDMEGAEPFVDPSCESYASCTEDWSPIVIVQGDPKKVVSAVRPLGKGFLVFAQQQHASQVQGGTFVTGFPWNRIVLSRLKPVRSPDASFVGSTLDDAPYEARSSRLRFVSSVMPENELRKVAKMDDMAVEYLTRRFGKDAFDLHPARNCIVGFSSPRVLPEWEKRLRNFDAIELKFAAPEKGVEGAFWKICFARSLSPHWTAQNSTEYSVATYMAAAAYDELRRRGCVTEADVGMADMIAFARKLDPDFTRYEKFGKPLSRETPELGPADKGKYIWGRYYARFEDLRKRRPDLLVRYRQVSQRRNGRNPTYDEFLDDLCEAYGSDWPRRWPAAEDKGER